MFPYSGVSAEDKIVIGLAQYYQHEEEADSISGFLEMDEKTVGWVLAGAHYSPEEKPKWDIWASTELFSEQEVDIVKNWHSRKEKHRNSDGMVDEIALSEEIIDELKLSTKNPEEIRGIIRKIIGKIHKTHRIEN